MCFQVYLGSYRECSEIPYVKGSNKILFINILSPTGFFLELQFSD